MGLTPWRSLERGEPPHRSDILPRPLRALASSLFIQCIKPNLGVHSQNSFSSARKTVCSIDANVTESGDWATGTERGAPALRGDVVIPNLAGSSAVPASL